MNAANMKNELRWLATLAAIQFVMLLLFTSWIPLHRMYGTADSAEFQRIALYIAGKGDLRQGYAQFFPPGEPFIVSMLYLLLGNIDYASLVTNFVFGLGCLFAVKSLTRSLRLSVLFMFIPYWFILSFSTLGDASFIFLQLLVARLATRDKWSECAILASLSIMFRPEGLFLMLVIATIALKRKRFEKKFLIPPALAVLALCLWGLVAFGNPFTYFAVYAAHRTSITANEVVRPWARDYALGLIGIGKITYVFATLIASIGTLVRCYRRFGLFHFFLLETLGLTLAHTILSPTVIYPDMAKNFVQIAPFTLIGFREFLLKRWVVVLAVLGPLSLFVAVVFWSVTFSVPFL